ncbi:MAG: SDR family NAD(P)-dependent oxidoreductase, partial [Bacteroidota bacterium]|nr:SDR family NAD(P)-dependent oxidoreductase [Bacteroidota bacterium]
MSELREKNAIVTGGARGIGRAIVRTLAEQGASVAVFDVAFPDDFTSFAAELRERGVRIEAFTVDITDSAAVDENCARVADDFGSIDILV